MFTQHRKWNVNIEIIYLKKNQYLGSVFLQNSFKVKNGKTLYFCFHATLS